MNKRFLSTFLGTLDSEHTRRAYKTDLTTFFEFLAGKSADLDVESVTSGNIQAFLSDMRSNDLAYATRRRRVTAIRRFYDWLERQDEVSHNPGRSADVQVRKSGEAKDQSRFLNKAELEKLVDTAGKRPMTGPRDQALILVIVYAALRRGEAAALNIDHVRPLGRHWVIDVPSASEGRGGFVKIPDLAANAVQRAVETYANDSGPLWRSYSNRNRGERMSPDALYKCVRALGEDADLGPISIELLRRSGLRLASASGANPSQVQSHARLQDATSVVRYFQSESENPRLKTTAADFVELDVDL